MHPSTIAWTEATWNPIRSCFKVSPGCKHCYAEAFAERFRGVPGHPYERGFDVRLVPHKLADPLRWTRPTTIFVNSMSDLFQEGMPAAYIPTVVDIMLLAPWHTFQVLTKRAARLPRPARYKVLFVPRSLYILSTPRLTSRFVSSILTQSDLKREPKTLFAIFRAQLHER